jgi:hypothetical protein
MVRSVIGALNYSDFVIIEFGVPVLCHRSQPYRLKLKDFVDSIKLASVRAGRRQVIEVVAIVTENGFRPDNGRSRLYLSV